jgi:hypothetical protein
MRLSQQRNGAVTSSTGNYDQDGIHYDENGFLERRLKPSAVGNIPTLAPFCKDIAHEVEVSIVCINERRAK